MIFKNLFSILIDVGSVSGKLVQQETDENLVRINYSCCSGSNV